MVRGNDDALTVLRHATAQALSVGAGVRAAEAGCFHRAVWCVALVDGVGRVDVRVARMVSRLSVGRFSAHLSACCGAGCSIRQCATPESVCKSHPCFFVCVLFVVCFTRSA